MVEFVDQRLIARGFLQRIEIGALNVLDDRKLERLTIADFKQHDRHFMQAGELRRAPAPFAGDDLVLIRGAARRAHQDRLDDAVLADRGRKLVKLGIGENAARIARIGF